MKPVLTALKRVKAMYVFGVFIFSFLLFIGCTRESDVTPAEVYSGEELFMGVILQKGEVAARLPLISKFSVQQANFTKQQYSEILQFENSIIAKIKEIEPDFFVKFQKEIQSGKEQRIQKSIEDGREIFVKALQSAPEYQDALHEGQELVAQINIESIKSEDGSIDKNKLDIELNRLGVNKLNAKNTLPKASCITFAGAVYVVFFVEVAVVSNVVGAVAGYLYAALYGPALESAASVASSEDILMKEMLVKQIAENLAI